MCSSFLVFSFTIFFSTFFFALILLIYIFFSARRTQEQTTNKCELNWIKDVVYTKSELCSQMHAKLVGLETQFFWSNFAILIFVNLAKVCTFSSLDAIFFVVLRRYKVCTFSSSDAKVMTVLCKAFESGGYMDERCGSNGWWWQGLMENKRGSHKLDWNMI